MADQDNIMVDRVAHAIADQFESGEKRNWRAYARVVLAAMREPTEAMTDAGGQYWEHFNEDSATTVWQAMIDEALQEPK